MGRQGAAREGLSRLKPPPERLRRRALLLGTGAWLAFARAPTFAQISRPRRIVFVYLGADTGSPLLGLLRSRLHELGHAEGRDIAVEIVLVDSVGKFSMVAADVVRRGPDLIVTGGTAAVTAFKKATASIPIVFTTIANPLEQGIVSSLARPGGNITGVAVYSGVRQKLVELVREALPAARRLAVLVDAGDPLAKMQATDFESAARTMKLEPIVLTVAAKEDLPRHFETLGKHKPDVLIAANGGLLAVRAVRRDVAQLALRAKLPFFSAVATDAAAGGLVTYGTDDEENMLRAAALVDRILRGAKPGDLPVEQPQRFYLAVNRRTERAIGVRVAPAVALRADRVIE